MEITDSTKAENAPSDTHGRRGGRRAAAVALAALAIWVVFAFVDGPSEQDETPAYVPPGMSCGAANLCAQEVPDNPAQDDRERNRPSPAWTPPRAQRLAREPVQREVGLRTDGRAKARIAPSGEDPPTIGRA